MKSVTSGQENRANAPVFIWTETFWTLLVHGFPLARTFAFPFQTPTRSSRVAVIAALPRCVGRVTPHCAPATQHDEGNEKRGARSYGTTDRCHSKFGHYVCLKDCWKSKSCICCLPESCIMSLSSLISRYSYRQSVYRLCIVDDYMNLDFFFFYQTLIVLEVFIH